ncbi:hypothetical protein Aduo_010720 [Ancylostoma duodenale]
MIPLFMLNVPMRRPNLNYQRLHPLRLFHENQDILRSKYRMREEHLHRLCNLVAPLMSQETTPNWSVDIENKVVIALRYLAANAHQMVLADNIGVCQKTVSNAIEEFVTALNHPSIVGKFLNCRLNDVTYCRRKANGFARKGLLPNIIGAIDGSLVPILRPPHSGWEYYCRKGFCALNVVAVVDARGRFMNINSNFPGSVHDSTVYNMSRIHDAFTEGSVPNGFCLIGDSGFANNNEIVTPFRNPQTRSQRKFNETHKKMRVIVECVLGDWKERFKILETTIRLEPDKAAQVVMACAVLHNMMISMRCGTMRSLGRRLASITHPPVGCRNIKDYLTSQIINYLSSL